MIPTEAQLQHFVNVVKGNVPYLEMLNDVRMRITTFPCIYLYNHGSLIGIAGICFTRNNVVLLWSMLAPAAKQQPIKLCKAALRLMKDLTECEDIQRIEAECLTGSDDDKKFVEFLGFTKESTMKCFGPNGEDIDKYAIIKGK